MNLPEEFSDETFYSLIARLARINNLKPNHPTINGLIGDQDKAADLVVDFDNFTNATNGVYGTADSLLRKYTNSTFSFAPTPRKRNLIGLSNNNRNIWRWCRSCAADEQENIGVTYWHIRHQHPCVLACLKHGISLQEINLPYRSRQSIFVLPEQAEEFQSINACSESELDLAMNIARNVDELIDDGHNLNVLKISRFFDQQQIREVIGSRIVEVTRIFMRGDSRRLSLLKRMILSGNISLQFLPISITAAFGSYSLFKSQYDWFCALANLDLQNDERPPKDDRQSHRKTCKEFKAQHPQSSRTDFWKMHPVSARWLMKQDSVWLDNHFPRRGKRVRQIRLFL